MRAAVVAKRPTPSEARRRMGGLAQRVYQFFRSDWHTRRPAVCQVAWPTPTASRHNVMNHRNVEADGFACARLALCDCRVGVMRGAKWLVSHKMATLAWDLVKKDERAIVVATTLEPGLSLKIFSMTAIRTRAGPRRFVSGEFQGG
jgi:hypothetical protein